MSALTHPSGAVIHMTGDRLNLTDMWKGAGAPEGMRPDDWKKDAANRKFLDHISDVTNTPMEGIWKGTRGNGGATWAHWQIGLAYAKYLSPEWHAWCNSVVRERMEGKAAPADETIRRIDGINRMLAHKVTGMEKELSELAAAVRALVITHDPRIAAVDAVPALQVAIDAKVPKAGRRPIVKAISDSIARHCEGTTHIIRRDARGTKLYPLAAVHEWRLQGGDSLIRKLVAANTVIGPLFAVVPGGKSA